MSGNQKQSSEGKSEQKQRRPEQKPQAEAGSTLETLGLASKGFTPGELPDAPNSRPLRQAAVLQMQRRHGNQTVQGYLSQQRQLKGAGPAPNGHDQVSTEALGQALTTRPLEPVTPVQAMSAGLLQRQAGAGVEVGTGGIKVELKLEGKKEFKAKWAKVSLKPAAAVMGELKPKQEHPGGVSASDSGGKISLNVYKDQAQAEGSRKFSQMAYDQLGEGSPWAIDKVDWETELGTGEEDGFGQASIATGVKFTFKNGHEAVAKATLFERSAKSGMAGPNVSLTPTFKFPEAKLWENKDAQLTLGGEIKFEMTLGPNWEEIFIELAKRGATEVGKQFARAALRGMVEFMLGAGGFIAGGIAVVATAYLSMESIDAIDDAKKAAYQSLDGYVHGFCIAWGIEEYGTGGAEKFFFKGVSDGSDKLKAMVQKIQAHPVFAPWKFTENELRVALKEKLRTRASDVYKQVESENKWPIYREITLQFYHRRKSLWYVPDYSAYKEAKWVALGLGFKDISFIPEPS